jgi:hypothetical protein
MRRFGVALAAMVILCVAQAGAFAQGFPGSFGPQGAGGQFPGAAGNIRPYNGCARPGCWGVPAFYVGWLEHSRGSTWTIHSQRQAASATATAPWALKGLWLEVAEDLNFGNCYGALVSAGVFLPQSSSGTWRRSFPVDEVEFTVPSYEWWQLEGLVTRRVSGPLELVAGLRWDRTSVRVNYVDRTLDDYILAAYVPLLGVQLNQRSATNSALIRFVGSPLVRGGLKYHFWTGTGYTEIGDFGVSDGSFMELLASYSLRVRTDLMLGGFVKWNALQLKTETSHLSGSITDPIWWDVDIRSWTFGGTVSLAFGCPF